MKKLINVYILLTLTVLVSSCGEIGDLDNFDGPDSKFFGSVIDAETGAFIPQELIEGSVIEYTELGFDNPQIQQLRFHTDGTFRNDLMFSGEYDVEAVRGNFFAPEKDTISINGDTEHIIRALPYLRIKDVNLVNDGTNIVATFKIDQIAAENVKTLSMIADLNPNVGKFLNIASTGVDINGAVNPDTVFTLQLSLNKFDLGKEYFFRVGALIDIPQAKYNYNVPIRFKVE